MEVNRIYNMDCIEGMQSIPDRSRVSRSKERYIMCYSTNKSEKDYLGEYYDISREGIVRRKKDGKVFIPVKDKKGYNMIRLKSPAFSKNKDRRKNYKVHRLIAMFYLDNYSEDLQVNHKNGIKTDNRVENLEMVTNRQNVLHAWRELDSSNRRRLVAQRNASDKERISKMIQASIRANSKTVTKKNDKGEVVSIYESSTKAAIAEGISGARMSYIIRHHKLRNNCYFYYE